MNSPQWLTIRGLILANEGGYTKDPEDPGNWTGGAINSGRLLGTKYGIAANTYPDLDIPNITLEQAEDIYETAYYDIVEGDDFPLVVAFLTTDAAVNSGPSRAIKWTQAALGVAQIDGVVGAKTKAAAMDQYTAGSASAANLYSQIVYNRLIGMMGFQAWAMAKHGWIIRLLNNTLVLHSLDPRVGVISNA